MDLPCINCIVLAMCRARIHQINGSYYSARSVVLSLSDNCSILRNYITSDQVIHHSDLKRVYNFLMTGYFDITNILIRENSSGTL